MMGPPHQNVSYNQGSALAPWPLSHGISSSSTFPLGLDISQHGGLKGVSFSPWQLIPVSIQMDTAWPGRYYAWSVSVASAIFYCSKDKKNKLESREQRNGIHLQKRQRQVHVFRERAGEDAAAISSETCHGPWFVITIIDAAVVHKNLCLSKVMHEKAENPCNFKSQCHDDWWLNHSETRMFPGTQAVPCTLSILTRTLFPLMRVLV